MGDQGPAKQKVIISRKNGYHGSTVAGASLGGMTYMHEQGDLPIPGIVHIAQPYWFGEGGDMSPEEFGVWAANQLEEKSWRSAWTTSVRSSPSRSRAPVA